MNLKEVAASTANYLYFPDIYGFLRRKLTGSQVAILMYHRVTPKEDDWSFESLDPESFEKHMEYFSRSYELLSMSELLQYLYQGKSLPKKAAVLTFDDGYKDNYIYAYPILKKYHFPAMIFLATGHIGTGELFWWDRLNYVIQHTTLDQLDLEELGYYSLRSNLDRLRAGLAINQKLKALPDRRKNFLIEKLINVCQVSIPPDAGKKYILSWDEVREMNEDSIEFGAHSVNHPILVNLPPKEARWEIIQSKRDIEAKLRQPVTVFSYPNGTFSNGLTRFVKESGFACAVSALPGKLISSRDDIYGLSRIDMGKDFSKCKVRLCGLWGDMRTILWRNG